MLVAFGIYEVIYISKAYEQRSAKLNTPTN